MSKKSVRIGRLVKVPNIKPKTFSHEADQYYTAWIKNLDGKPIPIMLTEPELLRAIKRAERNLEDRVSLSFISKLID